MKNQQLIKKNLIPLLKFCRKYKFISRTGAGSAYHRNEKSYIKSMIKIGRDWHICVNKYIEEMRKEYPQIDGKRSNKDFRIAAKRIQKYLAKHPNDPIFKPLKLNKKKEIAKNCKNISTKKIQKIAKKTLKKYLPPRTQKLDHQSMIDGAMSYLLNEYEDENKSCDEFKIIFLETIEEYLIYLLKEMDKKSA